MFEEICLACGKHLADDGSAYCSDECLNLDAASPSISSASSSQSSPHFQCTVGGDVPALMPSALGYALQKYRSHDRYSASSSSASSTLLTDDEDEDVYPGIGSDYSLHDPMDSALDGSSKSPGLFHSMYRNHSMMSYTRRPSGTNNRAAVSQLQRRTSFGSEGRPGQSAPYCPPLHSHSSSSEDSEDYYGLADEELPHVLPGSTQSDRHMMDELDRSIQPITVKSKRARNRASLPAYFSLLQTPSSLDAARQSPLSSSSGQTVILARRSPPTPKVSLAALRTTGLPVSSTTAPPTSTSHRTPRGRRQDVSPTASSQSRSTSRTRRESSTTIAAAAQNAYVYSKHLNDASESSSAPGLPPSRGRASMRRNSPSRALLTLSLGNDPQPVFQRQGSPERRQSRGRARVGELDGLGGTQEAPGYGHGRSGLLDRERRASRLRP